MIRVVVLPPRVEVLRPRVVVLRPRVEVLRPRVEVLRPRVVMPRPRVVVLRPRVKTIRIQILPEYSVYIQETTDALCPKKSKNQADQMIRDTVFRFHTWTRLIWIRN